MKKKGIYILVVLIVMVVVLLGLLFVKTSKVTVLFKSETEVPIYEQVTNLSFIEKVTGGTIKTKEESIDTSTLGTKEFTIVVSNRYGKEYTYHYAIEVVDKEKPILTYNKEIQIEQGEKIDLLKDVKVEDNSKEDISVSIEGEYDITKVGEYTIYYVAKDSSGNEAKESATLKVTKKVVASTSTSTTSSQSKTTSQKDTTFTTSKGFQGVTKNGVTYIDGILITNKTYSLPSTYGSGLTNTTLQAFNKMKEAAQKEGLNIYISSGFRSYQKQKTVYNNYVARDGKVAADTYSARPGYSEHQTGLSFDVNTISSAFDDTKEAKWLSENCYKYGFILRFPKGKDSETGYIYESWHFRYVGEELATKLYNNGDWITLENYFGITSKYEN
jgi:D-alanyl-D-alanine carboxypeptidase